jgi:hypothetical protein
MLKLNVYFFVFASILALLILALQNFSGFEYIFIAKFWVMFVFVAGITFMAINVCLLAITSSVSNTSFIILSANTIKLLFCMFFALFYLQNFKVNSLYFIVCFFSVYLLFTSFEIYTLLLNLRHLNKKLKTRN